MRSAVRRAAVYSTRRLSGIDLAVSPSDIAGMLLWLKADAGITKDGSNLVGTWADQSGNSNNAVMATAGAKPLWVDAVKNSLPAIRFDGTDDYMDLSATITTARTVFIVVNHDATHPFAAPVLGDTSNTNNPGLGRPHFHGDTTVGANYMMDSNYGYNDLMDGSGYVNGVATSPALMTKSTTFKVYSFVTLGNVIFNRITRDAGFASRVWKGDYLEIIAYNSALSNTDRQSVENHLISKWGL